MAIKPTDEEMEEINAMGRAIYQERIRPNLLPSDKGKVIFVNVETGEYELDRDEGAAMMRFMERFPNTVAYSKRVGYRYVHSFGYSKAFLEIDDDDD